MSVRLQGVSKAFGLTRAVNEVSLELNPGEVFAVLGPSGCGKTTLLRLVAGFERPDAGSIEVAGAVLAGPGCFTPPERRQIGMVFQDYALFPHLSVDRNGAFGVSRGERSAVRRTLELVGLQHKAERFPHELSGGERQRVALARALAPEPELVLLDEPFSSLDAGLRAALRREVELILRDAGATALLVTHDQEEALSLADRVGVMRDGRLVQVGDPEEVYRHPADRFTAQFVGEVNVLSGVAREGGVQTALGTFDCPSHAAGAVHVALRPEHLELRLDSAGNASVLEREFRGHDVLYRLRHQGGSTVLVQLPSVQLFEVGARVHVKPVRSASAPLVD